MDTLKVLDTDVSSSMRTRAMRLQKSQEHGYPAIWRWPSGVSVVLSIMPLPREEWTPTSCKEPTP